MAYVTREQIKSHIGLTGSSHNSTIDIYRGAASEACDMYTGRTFHTTAGSGFLTHSLTSNFTLDLQDVVRLQEWPIQSLTSIKLDGSALASDNYRLKSREGIVEMVDSASLPIRRSGHLQVTYVAGFTTVPTPVQVACLRLSSYWFARKSVEGMGAQLVGDIQETWRVPESGRILEDELRQYVLDSF